MGLTLVVPGKRMILKEQNLPSLHTHTYTTGWLALVVRRGRRSYVLIPVALSTCLYAYAHHPRMCLHTHTTSQVRRGSGVGGSGSVSLSQFP